MRLGRPPSKRSLDEDALSVLVVGAVLAAATVVVTPADSRPFAIAWATARVLPNMDS